MRLALLLGPAWWWSGFHAHPQGLTLAVQLLSLIAFMEAWRRPARPSVAWLTLSVLLLTVSLVIKGDAILLAPAYLGLRLFQRSVRRETRQFSLAMSVAVTAATAS